MKGQTITRLLGKQGVLMLIGFILLGIGSSNRLTGAETYIMFSER